MRNQADMFRRRAAQLSAPAYVEALMTWAQTILDDEKHFPQKIGELSLPREPRWSPQLTGNRCQVPSDFYGYRQDHLEAAVPGLRTYLPFAL